MTLVAKSKPDGYNLVSSSMSPVLFAPYLQKVEYNSLTDFTYIAGTGIQPFGIVVRSDAPWKTFEELMDYVKKNPGNVKYGSSGLGGLPHIYMEMIGKARGLNWVHIPFKGDQSSITALLGGHIPVASMSSDFVRLARAGKFRALVVLAENRISAFPQVPALKEFGFTFDLRGNEVLGFAGPKGVPPKVLKKLENAFKQAVESGEYKQVMEQLANEGKFRDSQTFTKILQELYPQIGEMIKQLGLSRP
jgi:tripartite-type tricarboxylate transporter receptor subunit TctC